MYREYNAGLTVKNVSWKGLTIIITESWLLRNDKENGRNFIVIKGEGLEKIMAILAFNHNSEVRKQREVSPSAKNPVDLVHLSRQTLGERSLEIEVLSIFKCQSKLYIDRLENAKTASERRMAAHTILGSARGIGAWRVAQMAEQYEEICSNESDVSELKAAIEEANAYIGELLNQ